MSKAVRAVLKALSYGGIEVEASRHLANLKALDPMKIFYKTIDEKVYNGEHEVPLRIYLPNAEALKGPRTIGNTYPVMLFFHGAAGLQSRLKTMTGSVPEWRRVLAMWLCLWTTDWRRSTPFPQG